MNERLTDLFSETDLHRNDHTTEQRIAEVERFAKFIAQECAEIARGVMREEGSNMSWDDLTRIQNQIKELVGGW